MKRIAYGKLGRSIPLRYESASNVGGDIEVVRLLDLLAEDYEVHVVGRNQLDNDREDVVNHWAEGGTFHGCPPAGRSIDDPDWIKFKAFMDERTPQLPKFDAWVIWLGQHGSSLHPVPMTMKGRTGTTSPLISLVNYGYPLVHMINAHGVKPIWLCPDPRNMVKFRDLWDPKQGTILAQYNDSKANTFYDERDGKLREGSTKYMYAGIEMLALPPGRVYLETLPMAPPLPFGILVNEGPTNLSRNGRLELVHNWIRAGEKHLGETWEIFGTWTEESQRELNREIYPIVVSDVRKVMQRWRSTITFPASGTGWATAKPWEAFAAGTVCFKHPAYDDQGHIYSTEHMPLELLNFLTPRFPTELWSRVEQLEDDDTWYRYAKLQLDYLHESRVRLGHGYRWVKKFIDEETL